LVEEVSEATLEDNHHSEKEGSLNLPPTSKLTAWANLFGGFLCSDNS
jgi:acyl-CoA-binding protein